MLTSQSKFKTEKPTKYLVQMCKHFAHKTETTYTETEGKVIFSWGVAQLSIIDDDLLFTVQAENNEDLIRSKSIIESHIIKFAFREKLEGLEWST